MDLSTSTERQTLEQVVEEIFGEMLLSYGERFQKMWGVDVPIDSVIAFWAAQLRGFTPREIRRGRESAMNLEWPPSLPQFKNLCRPPVEHLKAYYEAVAGCQARRAGEMGEWSHPAIFWAASKMNYDLLNHTYSQVKDRWERELDEQLSRGEWEEIPVPTLALPAPKPQTSAQAQDVLKKLRAETVVRDSPDGRDPKAWAKKIMQREREGDKSLLPIQIKFAAMALNTEVAEHE